MPFQWRGLPHKLAPSGTDWFSISPVTDKPFQTEKEAVADARAFHWKNGEFETRETP